MSDFFNHAITVGDLFMAGAVGIVLLIAFLGFVVLAVNMGWVR